MSKKMLGYGILTWDRHERVSNRYGMVKLMCNTYAEDVALDMALHFDSLNEMRDKRVHLTALVKESRKSSHIGDMFLGIFPSQPEVGEIVDLGVGTFSFLTKDGQTSMFLQPGDGRSELWINPHKLYRLHDQTVELYAEFTEDADTPMVQLNLDESGAESLGDGAIQVKKKDIEDISLPVQKLGDGLFALNIVPEKGKRF